MVPVRLPNLQAPCKGLWWLEQEWEQWRRQEVHGFRLRLKVELPELAHSCLCMCLITLLYAVQDLASIHTCNLIFHRSPAWAHCHDYHQTRAMCFFLAYVFLLISASVSLPVQLPIPGVTSTLPSSSMAQSYSSLKLKSAFTFSGSFSCFSQVSSVGFSSLTLSSITALITLIWTCMCIYLSLTWDCK